jgi:hypothetical protein
MNGYWHILEPEGRQLTGYIYTRPGGDWEVRELKLSVYFNEWFHQSVDDNEALKEMFIRDYLAWREMHGGREGA